MALTFCNPRRAATFTDWPLGGNRRGDCVFQVHADAKRGERVSRTTTGKPKYTNYGTKCAVVDGSNGRTYVLQLSTDYGPSVRVICSDLMYDATKDLGRDSSYFRENDPEFSDLVNLVFAAV